MLSLLLLVSSAAAEPELTAARAETLLEEGLAASDSTWFDVRTWAQAVVMPIALNGFGGPPPTDGIWMLEEGHDAEWAKLRETGATQVREAITAGRCKVNGLRDPVRPAANLDPVFTYNHDELLKLDRLVHATLECGEPDMTRWGGRWGSSDRLFGAVYTRVAGTWRVAGLEFGSDSELWTRFEADLTRDVVAEEGVKATEVAARPGPEITRWAPPGLGARKPAVGHDLNGNARPDAVLGPLTPGVLSVLVDGAEVRIPQKFFSRYFGEQARLGGDLTGDGRPDLVIDAPGDSPAGAPDIPDAVWVVPGGARFAAGTHLRLDEPGPDVRGFGRSLVTPGDLDGDGRADLVVGAERRLYTYFGGALTAPGGQIDLPRDSFLSQIVPAGDLDGDGAADVWLKVNDADQSRMYLLHGGARARLERVPSLDPAQPRATVTLPGDRLPSLVAWVPGSGRATTLYRADGAGWVQAWVSKEAEPSTVISADVTGDGVPELLVTSPAARTPSVTVLAADGSLVLRLAPPVGVREFGRRITAPGDVTGDGAPDLLVAWSGGAGAWTLPLTEGAAPTTTWGKR